MGRKESTIFFSKSGCLNSQSSTLKIVPAVPSVCCEKQVFSTSKSVAKTINVICIMWYYKTLFWNYIGTFYSPSEKRKKYIKKSHLSVSLGIQEMLVRDSPPAQSILCSSARTRYILLATGSTYENRKSSQHYWTFVDVDVSSKNKQKIN